MSGKITGGSGARGIPGGQAIGDRLTELAEGVRSPIDSDRGLSARLRYLTRSAAGYDAMNQAGIDVTARTFTAWLSEDRTPTKANLAKIDAAYNQLHAQNMAASLTRRLDNGGRGTRIEVHPIDQTGVPAEHRRDLPVRKVTIPAADWKRLVRHWADGDLDAMNSTWEAIAADTLGTNWGAYGAVSHIGFGA